MSTFPDPYSKCLLESNISELFPSLMGCLLTCHGLPPLALHLSPTSWGLVDHLLSQTLVRHHAWHVRHPTLLQGQRRTTVSESSIYYKAIHSNSWLVHSYWLLLAEKETAKLWIGSWICEAKDGTLGRGLSASRNLIRWSATDGRLLIGWSGGSHCHLKERHTV